MKPMEFPQQTMVLAKDQPEYIPLPVFYDSQGPEGIAISCFKLSWRERIKILFTGRLWIQQLTFHRGFSPQLPSVDTLFKG